MGYGAPHLSDTLFILQIIDYVLTKSVYDVTSHYHDTRVLLLLLLSATFIFDLHDLPNSTQYVCHAWL